MKKACLLLLAVSAACAAKGPIPSGDKPAWVSTPNGDVRFPPDRFIAQVGTTSVGVKPAPELLATVDAAARTAVAAVLLSLVGSEQIVREFDLLAAIEIQGRWREGDTAYAWAVFDKGKALALQQGKVDDREKLVKELLAQGEAAEAEKPAEALRAYARARTEAAASIDGVLLLRALGGKTDLSGTMAQSESKVSALMRELTLSVVEGDQQRAAEGKPLPQPIVFTAWLKGKRAVGLPMAVVVPNGGRASNVTVGPDGKAEVRVDDIGRFAANEQQIQIAVDWPGLLGVAADKGPAWIAAEAKAGISATALKKSVATPRVLVLVQEHIVAGAPAVEKMTSELTLQGFDVQNGRALVKKFGAARIARMTDAQTCEAACRVAEVVVVGGSEGIRAIEVSTGAVLFTAPAGEKAGADLASALKKSIER
jgi:hypothetical protein